MNGMRDAVGALHHIKGKGIERSEIFRSNADSGIGPGLEIGMSLSQWHSIQAYDMIYRGIHLTQVTTKYMG